MKYNHRVLWFIFALALGLFGSVLRGHELAVCYDYASGLYTYDLSSYILPALCTAGGVVFLIVSLASKKYAAQHPYAERFALSKGGAVLGMLSALIIAAAGAYDILSAYKEFSIYELLLGILSVLTGVCIVILTVKRKKADEAPVIRLPLVVTVFWSAFLLILTYMEHPVEPILQYFAYDLLAACAATLSLCCQAAYEMRKKREKLGLFASLAAVMLLTIAVFGRLTAVWLSGETVFFTEAPFRITAMAGLIIYCSLGVCAYLRVPAGSEKQEEEK